MVLNRASLLLSVAIVLLNAPTRLSSLEEVDEATLNMLKMFKLFLMHPPSAATFIACALGPLSQ
ncbi:hypothetical protein C0995_002647 [Termitomyces sp. Mi166|nr:hypothetical protein C0995_002647 [Termitomyces sp. Mi166\